MKLNLFVIAIALASMHCSKEEQAKEEAPGAERAPEPATKAAEEDPAPKEGIAVHCDQIEELGYCTETPYAAPTWEALGEESLKERCSTGTFAKAECSQDGAVGSCTSGNGEVIQFYSRGNKPRTAEEASAFCSEMFSGTFKNL